MIANKHENKIEFYNFYQFVSVVFNCNEKREASSSVMPGVS